MAFKEDLHYCDHLVTVNKHLDDWAFYLIIQDYAKLFYLFLHTCSRHNNLMSDLEQNSDSADPEIPQILAAVGVTVEIFILLLILPVCFLELCDRKRNQSRQTQITQRLMIAVFLSNCANQVTCILIMTTCTNCTVTGVSYMYSRIILRGINWLFLIHRAKLVQGMTSILSTKWFNKILPIFVVIWIIGTLVWTTFVNDIIEREYQCLSYTDSDTLQWCWDLDYETTSSDLISLSFFLTMDLLATVFLLILFIVPLYRVYNTDLGRMNLNQLKHRTKLKRLLIWSVILALINQISSIFIWLLSFDRSPLSMVLYFFIGRFDAPINVWTSWLMITRNREFLHRVLCCCCTKKKERRLVSQELAFTNLSSKNSGGPSPP